MLREISLIVHIAGVVLWVGGAAAAAWTAAQLAAATPGVRAEGLGAVRRALLAVVTPGILLAWVGGLTLFLSALDLYARAGYLHGKITIAVVISALHGVLVARVRKAAGGTRETSAATFGGLAMGIVVLALVAVVLVILKPGS